MRKASLYLLAVLTLAGCSGAAENKLGADSLVREIKANSIGEAASISAAAHLTCEGECPGNVGLFLAAKPDGLLSCTAFLIGDDLVATNSHCLPAAVKDVAGICAERVRIIFPRASGQGEESFACAEVMGASERPNALSPDLAVIKLAKKTTRSFVRISREGINPGATYRAVKVNPADGASGVIVKADCLAVANSYRYPLYSKPSDPVVTVGDCKSIVGNSGSPLLSKNGEAVGILQADLGVGDLARKTWEPHLAPGESFAPLALATNLACLASASPWAFACSVVDEETLERPRIEEFLPTLDASSEGLLAPWKAKLPPQFRWERKELNARALKRETTLAPTCLNDIAAWDFPVSETLALTADLPVLEERLVFNRYMQVSAEARITGNIQTDITFSPATFASFGSTPVKLGSEEAQTLSTCAN
jgi:hypothetical protein